MTLVSGLVLLAIAWQVPRRVAATRWRWNAALALDAVFPLAVFVLVAGLSNRPLFAGISTLAVAAAYAYADRAKRRTLDEPIVFTDVFQAFDVFRHPQLSLPFPNKIRIVVSVLVGLNVTLALFFAETPVPLGAPYPGLAVLVLFLAMRHVRPGPRAVAWLRSLGPSGDPKDDAALLGPLGMHLVHGLAACGEREALRERAPRLKGFVRGVTADAAPVVVVQSESFFDARRLHKAIDRSLLPNFDRACAEGMQWGRLDVPCWGANTVRTEFAVLTGLSAGDVGFDRFDPFRRFANVPIPSLASRYRELGYRTLCLHPFDRTFYRRDQVLPNLGFDEMLGEESFPADATRINGYISDDAVARRVLELIEREGPRVFIFVVTMENHGPWPGGAGQGPSLPAALDLPPAQRELLGRYLSSLANADRMLEVLMGALSAHPQGGTLAFYGDHLPGFGDAYTRLSFDDRRSDYVLWQPRHAAAGARVDLPAEHLAAAILSGTSSAPARVLESASAR